MKPIDARISYFFKKFNQYFSSKKRNRYREHRLHVYKREMDRRIKAQYPEIARRHGK